jgi:hypothetical protein
MKYSQAEARNRGAVIAVMAVMAVIAFKPNVHQYAPRFKRCG